MVTSRKQVRIKHLTTTIAFGMACSVTIMLVLRVVFTCLIVCIKFNNNQVTRHFPKKIAALPNLTSMNLAIDSAEAFYGKPTTIMF